MKNDDEIIKDLVTGGIVGSILGSIISENKNGSVLGAIAGAAILATYRANQTAIKAKLPVMVSKHDSIYEIMPNGERRFVKKIIKSKKTIPASFKIK